jgi:hypothetical protein
MIAKKAMIGDISTPIGGKILRMGCKTGSVVL